MSQLVRLLNSVSRRDTPTVGAKAALLGELRQAGFNVPDGIVLTTDAYAEFITPLRERILARLTENVINDPAELEGAASEIRGWLEAQPFSPVLLSEMESALATLPPREPSSYAARTSPASDDLATAIGSGVARAYLGLVGTEELSRNAARCWAAIWNSRAIYYRYRKKLGQTEVAIAVLIQPMVAADSAGVMFTQNPMSNAQNEIQISSIWGLGAPLTSARFRPDQFLLDKGNDEILDRTVEEQVVKLVVGSDGHCEERGIPPPQSEESSLTDDELKALAELGKKVQTFFGEPQDIEWAFRGDELVLIQARPFGMRNS